MRLFYSRYLLFAVAIIGCLNFVTACSQKNTDCAEIQAALISDAGIEKTTFDSIAKSDAPSKVSEQDSQNLTFVLMLYAPGKYDESPEKLRQEIELIPDTPPPPAKLFEPLMKNQVGDKYSIILQEEIQEFTCNVAGNRAQGNVKFRYPEFFVANVQYRAEKKDDKWRITEFLFPYHDIKLVNDGKQRWLASGSGIQPRPLRLPTVAGIPVRDLKAPSLRVNIGLNPKSDVSAAPSENLFVFEGEGITKLADFEKTLSTTIKAFEQKHQTTAPRIALLLWVDRRAEWGPLEQFLRAAAEVGIKDVRLAAESRSSLQNSDELISLGEFQLLIPRTIEEGYVLAEEPFPKMLSIRADEQGQVKLIVFEGQILKFEEFQAVAIKESKIVESKLNLGGNPHITLAIKADPKLEYGHLLNVLSACGVLKDTAVPQLKVFTPFYDKLYLKIPEESLDLQLQVEPQLKSDLDSKIDHDSKVSPPSETRRMIK